MSSPRPITPRDFALEVVQRLRAAGYEAVWAGGCVRDYLLGISPKDYDVATSAKPDQVRALFGRRQTLPIGASFGVISVRGPRSAGAIEVATFRSEGTYSDGRHPDRVEFTTAELDAQRRDFTINGIFYDPLTDEVLDFVGGQRDLAEGIVRAIGDADARLAEDKLRMLRAVRFAARFDFTLDPGTHQAIVRHAPELTAVSGERIGSEMRAMLLHPSRVRALQLLRDTTLLGAVLPELEDVAASDWPVLEGVLARLCEPSFAVVLAAILHQLDGERVSGGIAQRWRLANRDTERADWILEHLPSILSAASLPWHRLQRILVHPGASELVDLGEAIAPDDDPSMALCRDCLALPPHEFNPPPLVTGDDLLQHGIPAGPHLGWLLEKIRDAQLEGTIHTRDEALQLATRLDTGRVTE